MILGSKVLKCANARSVCATRNYLPVGKEILNSHVHLGASLLSLHLVLFPLEMLHVKDSMNNRTQNRNKKHFCPALLSIQKTMVLICYPHAGKGKLTKPNCSQSQTAVKPFNREGFSLHPAPQKHVQSRLATSIKALLQAWKSTGTTFTLHWVITYLMQEEEHMTQFSKNYFLEGKRV